MPSLHGPLVGVDLQLFESTGRLPPNPHDATRAPYDSAAPWDRTVRYVRARDRLIARGCDPAARLEVTRQDGIPVLSVDGQSEMREAL